MMRKIAVITGTRAEYGILKPVIRAIDAHPELELSLIVMGMHLLQDFGFTLREIENDSFEIAAKIEGLYAKDSGEDMARSVGEGIVQLARTLVRLKPDVLLLLGDRGEMLAGAVAATFMNIPIGHIHGGDVSGNVDEPVRHAITKLAHIHFPATKESAQRIIAMGEDPSYTFTVGAPGLETIFHEKFIEPPVLAEKYHLDLSQPLLLVLQHPVTTEVDEAPGQIRETLEAIADLQYQTILIYPNADAGGRRMIEVIKEYETEKYPFIGTFKSISHEEYLSLMKIASLLVGNSSSGIIEAPSFGVPVVNIGSRQQGRQRAENIIDVGYNRAQIAAAIRTALDDEAFKAKSRSGKNPYGDGRAGERIAKILAGIKIDKNLLKKRMSY
ncbi:MAG: UDP-N-acetylglucosamine 2-epimerase (hydrolyzing) [Methanomicrobia archaeon]|nr:UDP-N-acetylglucosamine 2-epimerase (hydrolyzing) [Methanomicrobia archaeon]